MKPGDFRRLPKRKFAQARGLNMHTVKFKYAYCKITS